MQAFAAAVHQGRAGQFQLADNGLLLFQLHVVAFHQGIAVVGHIVVAAAALHGVEADPGTGGGVVIAHHSADVPAAAGKLVHQLTGGAVPAAFCGGIAVIPQVAFGHIGHMVLRLKQGLQVAVQLVGGVPLFGDVQLLHIQPAGIHHNAVRPGAGGADCIVPVQLMPGGARPAVIVC